MERESEIRALESEWSPEGGFFWELRHGNFSATEFQRVLAMVAAISIAEEESVPRRLVSLLWFIPQFMEWQVERVGECGGDSAQYEAAISRMTTEVMRLLGVP